jgi:hypothetical protein
MKHCKWCDGQFSTEISYQIYCSEECRNSATKEKVAERYAIARRTKRMSKKRKCKSCGGPVSAYNDDPLCGACTVNPSEVTRALKEIRGLGNEA